MKKACISLILTACILLSGCGAAAPEETESSVIEMPVEEVSVSAAAVEPDAASYQYDPNIVDNAAGADEETARAVALRLREDERQDVEWFDKRTAEGVKVKIYAAITFENGILALADFYIGGEVGPDLFYVENGKVSARTYGGDCWSINYARLYGHTIAYGRSFAWNGGPGEVGYIPTTHAEGEFFNRETVRCDMPAGNGFILAVPGDTWLKAVRLYDDEILVCDDTCGEFVKFHGERGGWENTEYVVRERTSFHSFYDGKAGGIMRSPEDGWPAVVIDGKAYGMQRYAKNEGLLFPDLWRNDNWMHQMTEVTGGAEFTFQNLPETDEEQLVFCVNMALDNGAEDSYAAEEAALSQYKTPQLPGYYMLIVDSGDGHYYTSAMYVISQG